MTLDSSTSVTSKPSGAPSIDTLANLNDMLRTDAGVSTGKSNRVGGTSATLLAANVAANKAGNSLDKIAPQAYVVAAAYTVGTKIGPFEVGTKILVAGLANAGAANKGDLTGAVQKGTLFVSITLPGAKTPVVGTYNPSTQAFEWGKGIAPKAFYGGNAILFANGRTGVAAQPSGTAVVSGNAGVLLKIPGSEAISGALAKLVSGGTRVIQAGELATLNAAGIPGVVAEEALRKVLSDTVASGKLYVGVAYRASVEDASGRVTVKGLNGSFEPEQLVNQALTKLAFDSNNFGVSEVAYGKNRWLTDRGTSYFQLSPISGNRNHGDPALELVNSINAAGRKYNVLPNRVGPADVSTDGRKVQYVKLWQNVASGQQAEALLSRLKATLPPQDWQALVNQLRPSAQRLGVNFGQTELGGGGAPRSEDDAKSRATLLRDYNKNSRPQEYREIISQVAPPGQNHMIP